MGKNSTQQISIQRIAEEAGVSTATVSRVFNRHPYVSDAIRERVTTIAREIGYAPTISSSRFLFGILVSSDSGYSFQPYFNQVIQAISMHFFQRGYNVQIFNHAMFPYILKNTFRGVVLFVKKDALFFMKAHIPCVVISDPIEGACNVVTDHQEGLRLAAEHLLKLGHRRIAFLHSSIKSWGTAERLLGFHQAMTAAGIPFEEHLCGTFALQHDIPSAIEKLLKKKPTAMIVEGEDHGLIADHTLKKMNVRIPEDLSLITFESDPYSAFMTPEHTTVSQNFKELGYCAAETLLQIALHPAVAKKLPSMQILHNKLIERASCAPLKNV